MVLQMQLRHIQQADASLQVFAGGTKVSQALSQKVIEALFGA